MWWWSIVTFSATSFLVCWLYSTTFSGQPRVFQPHKNSDCNSTSLKKEDVVQKENHKVLIGSVRATINPRPRLEKYTAHGSHTWNYSHHIFLGAPIHFEKKTRSYNQSSFLPIITRTRDNREPKNRSLFSTMRTALAVFRWSWSCSCGQNPKKIGM